MLNTQKNQDQPMYQEISKVINQHEIPALSADQYLRIIHFLWKELDDHELIPKMNEETSNNIIDNFLKQQDVSQLNLSIRSRRTLMRMNINSLYDLCLTNKADLLAHKNFGENSLNEIKEKMAERGLSLRSIFRED